MKSPFPHWLLLREWHLSAQIVLMANRRANCRGNSHSLAAVALSIPAARVSPAMEIVVNAPAPMLKSALAVRQEVVGDERRPCLYFAPVKTILEAGN